MVVQAVPLSVCAYVQAPSGVVRVSVAVLPSAQVIPFDPAESFHATHVAGIAAGDPTVVAGQTISGVAPKAYLGNYKALTIPTPDFGLDGNSAEITAAIEAAVADGMNVINLSLGEPEVEPSRDIVVQAIDGAAAAGVVPVVAAGNDFEDFGYGSVSSPGNAPGAITKNPRKQRPYASPLPKTVAAIKCNSSISSDLRSSSGASPKVCALSSPPMRRPVGAA